MKLSASTSSPATSSCSDPARPGEVWVLRCIGVHLLAVVLRVDESVWFLNLETGNVMEWSRIIVGLGVGEWTSFERWKP